MKRVLSSILIITLMSLFYIFQNAKTLEYSYNIHSAKKSLSLLIDQNNSLRYNIAKLESPARLEEIVVNSQDNNIYTPLDCYKIRIEEIGRVNNIDSGNGFLKAGNMILSMFSLDSEAIAGDLNE